MLTLAYHSRLVVLSAVFSAATTVLRALIDRRSSQLLQMWMDDAMIVRPRVGRHCWLKTGCITGDVASQKRMSCGCDLWRQVMISLNTSADLSCKIGRLIRGREIWRLEFRTGRLKRSSWSGVELSAVLNFT